MYGVPWEQHPDTFYTNAKRKALLEDQVMQQTEKNILGKLQNHSHPLKPSKHLYNIVNGKKATPNINVYECVSVGEKLAETVSDAFPAGFQTQIYCQVKTMEALKKKSCSTVRKYMTLSLYLHGF